MTVFNPIFNRFLDFWSYLAQSPLRLVLALSVGINAALVLYLLFSGILLKALLYTGLVFLVVYGMLSLIRQVLGGMKMS